VHYESKRLGASFCFFDIEQLGFFLRGKTAPAIDDYPTGSSGYFVPTRRQSGRFIG